MWTNNVVKLLLKINTWIQIVQQGVQIHRPQYGLRHREMVGSTKNPLKISISEDILYICLDKI